MLDRLREAAELHHLTYAPDPATHSRCTLGGMIGNNSCGVHGLLGGKVVDNVESLDIVLYDGTRMTVGRTSPEQLEALIRGGGRVGADLCRSRPLARPLRRPGPRKISAHSPPRLRLQPRRAAAGKRLQRRARAGGLAKAPAPTIVSATLNLTASPPFRVLTVLGFDDAFLAADAVPQALEHRPDRPGGL